MKLKPYEQAKAKVFDRLKNITDVSFLNGWMKFYLEDLIKGKNIPDMPSFPCVSCHYADDNHSGWGSGSMKVKSKRTINISGAIRVGSRDRDTVNERLDTLHDTVLDALAGFEGLTFNSTRFSIPDGSTEYAMFDLNITIDIHRSIKNEKEF